MLEAVRAWLCVPDVLAVAAGDLVALEESVAACVAETDGVADCDCEAEPDWLGVEVGLAVTACEAVDAWLRDCVPLCVASCVRVAVGERLGVAAELGVPVCVPVESGLRLGVPL